MSDENMKEIDYKTYCKRCEFEEISEVKDPCNECLEVSGRPGTRKPEKFKEKSGK